MRAIVETPIRVCTASVQNFGARCDVPEGEADATAPAAGWCPGQETTCGYDHDIFREAMLRVGLIRDEHYTIACRNASGFNDMITDLANGTGACDMGVSAITIASLREDAGITFSRPIFQTWLSALTFAPDRRVGGWLIVHPLKASVWLASLATFAITPLLVFAVDILFANASIYVRVSNGRLLIMHSLGEILWACFSHVMLLDYIQATSMPARLILVGFGILTFTVSNTYTASLVAALTTRPKQTTNLNGLRGMTVATTATYAERVHNQTDVSEISTFQTLPYDDLVVRLTSPSRLDAVVYDDVQMQAVAATDSQCTLKTTPINTLPFDIGFAYRNNFSAEYPGFVRAVDNALLYMQQQGVLERTKIAHSPPVRTCEDARFESAEQVNLPAMQALWVILGVGSILATLIACASYALAHVEGSRVRRDALDRRARDLWIAGPDEDPSPRRWTDASDVAEPRDIRATTGASARTSARSFMSATGDASTLVRRIRGIVSQTKSLHVKAAALIDKGSR